MVPPTFIKLGKFASIKFENWIRIPNGLGELSATPTYRYNIHNVFNYLLLVSKLTSKWGMQLPELIEGVEEEALLSILYFSLEVFKKFTFNIPQMVSF